MEIIRSFNYNSKTIIFKLVNIMETEETQSRGTLLKMFEHQWRGDPPSKAFPGICRISVMPAMKVTVA